MKLVTRGAVFACLAAATIPVGAPPIVVREYKSGLPGVHAANRDTKLSLAPDPTDRDRSVLVVDYPGADGGPRGTRHLARQRNSGLDSGARDRVPREV